ncbi:MAG: D-alanyl-D-alanine carboxypeptidase/D-alanyl-D-alanine-endopeptidase [Bacteroidetes bacterium]|nr:D-alanyl-D-alanine carboxypeptidase/D-alanyl-D-alanine-endopeptidase [Bacteroidota bacterium]
MHQSFRVVLLLAGLGLWLGLPAQNAWQRAADRLANHPSLKHGSISLCVVEVESGRTVAAVSPGQSLRPASNLKVLTTGSALAMLGPNYRYTTSLSYEGQINGEGQLQGDLVLSGNGDPTLGSAEMEGKPGPTRLLRQLRLSVQRAGIRQVKGAIVADAHVFGSQAYCRSWPWEDLGNYYAAGVWSLNWHENMYYLDFQQAAQGRRPGIAGTRPSIPGLTLVNELTSGAPGSGDQAYLFGGPYQMERYVRGSIPAGSGRFSIKGSIPNPPLFLAQELRRSLSEVAIGSGPPDVRFHPSAGNAGPTLFTHRSPTLAAIAGRCNMKSVNLYSEALLRTIGLERGPEASPAGGIEAMRQYWEGRGLSWSGVYLEDGSGLSPSNAVPARFLAAFMRKMAVGPAKAAAAFRASLPVAGRSGSMQYSLRGTRAEGRLRAKTGTMRRVRAFTGYATARGGQELAFAVIVNDFSGSGGRMRQLLEQFLLALCEN